MTGTALGFAIGVIATGWMPVLPDPVWALGGLLVLPMFRLHRPWPVAAAAVLGFCYCWLVAGVQLGERLPAELDGAVFAVTGVVDGLPERGERRSRFNLAVESLDGPEGRVSGPDRLRLSWYENAPALEPGQRWRLSVKLRRPHGFFNPGGFDYERWLFREGIDATGYVTDDRSPEHLGRARDPAALLDRWRDRIGRRVADAVEGPASFLLPALTVGDRRGLDDGHWQVLNATGTSHLVAISGLHVGLVAGFGMLAGGGLARLFPPLLRRRPARHWGAAAACLGAVAYAAMAGFALPTQRALVMVCVVLGALVGRRTARPAAAIGLALAAVLLVDPLAPLGSGFWLSFLAVVVLVAAFAGRLRPRSALRDSARAQWVVGLGLAVPVAVLFQRLAWVAPVVNLLAVPLVGLVAVPLALSGLVLMPWPAGSWLLSGAGMVLDGFWQATSWLAERPEVVRKVAAPGPAAVLAGMLGVTWLMAPRGVPARWLGAVLLAPLAWGSVEAPGEGRFRLSVLDVGQGLAAVVRTANHVLVYDTGPSFRSGFNTAEAVVAPYLLAAAGGELDRLVVSHGDSDHAGGAVSLARRFDPADVLAGESGLEGARRCREGMRWRWDGVGFRILHPPPGLPDLGNASSCVLKVTGDDGSALLTGDITRAVERRLVARYGDALTTDILVVPHHGSDSSSTRDFVEGAASRWAVFSAGFGNRFGLPDPTVTARYRKQGARRVDTATAGMVRFEPSGAAGWQLIRWRRAAGRYWTDRLSESS